MDIGFIVQIIIFGLLSLAGLVIVFGALKAVSRPHKIKSYRYSKKGDAWILGKKP